ncbi:MAG: D-3-phosphoglycerate dehydrogenase / 2-oxoglutarate reductase [Candidatus Atribacteria bacterium]|nr:D-3-phosphoglycerate dehydrogenase / 2-oxoglutarate reductase [Candidatus Atribacteria bacterium]
MEQNEWYVLLPQPIEEEALEILKNSGFKTIVAPEPNVEVVAPLIKKARAIVLRTGIRLNRELLTEADNLWIISRTGTGVDNVDVKAATEKGIIVTSSVGVNAITVAEHTLSLILSLFKQLFLLDKETRRGNFEIRYKNYPQDIRGKKLGVVGFGKIGQLVAKYFYNLSKEKVFVYDPFLPEGLKSNFSNFAEFVELQELLKFSDVVSIHVPLNKYTSNMIARKELITMKPTAYLINTSRGGVVREQDLIEVLQRGIIRGAALDVFEKEPIDSSNPLLKMDNVVLTPHTAALTKECVVRMAVSAVKRVVDLLNGYLPDNVANPEVLKAERWQNLKKKEVEDISE